MKIQAEVADAFGAATGEKNSFPIINRYAESVTSRYDIGVLPDALEVRAYAEVIKSAAMGGFRGLYQNVRSADVLGHPVTLTNEVKWDHVPPIPDVDARDVEAFVEDVLDEENEKTGLLPRDVEMEIYRNAFITGIYVMEDTLKSLRIRLFRTEYGFEIAPSAAGWRCTQKPPPLTDQQLVRLMREELKAPAITRLFPTVERNVARVAAALAGEVVGSTEFLFLGLPLRFELRPPAPPKVDDSKVPSLEDMARKKRREKRKKREAAKASAETTALIENYVDGYLASQRSGGGPLDGGLFFSRKLERDTYVGFLSQMIGNVEGSTIANVMGFDVVLRVGRAGRDAEGKLKLPEITFARASRAEREAIEQFVDWVMADPVYNIKAVPDVIERQIYINVFELTSTLLASGLSTFELELLGRNITMRGAEARVEDAPSVATSERFKPNPEMLRRFAAETTDVEAVQEVMCNVYAFVLAFVAFEMQGIETTIVGRRLRFGLGQPEERLEDLPRIETEFNANLRRALALLVSEMIEAAVAGGGESGGEGRRARRRGGADGRRQEGLPRVRTRGVREARRRRQVERAGVPQGGQRAGAPRRPVEQTRGRGGGHLRHVRQEQIQRGRRVPVPVPQPGAVRRRGDGPREGAPAGEDGAEKSRQRGGRRRRRQRRRRHPVGRVLLRRKGTRRNLRQGGRGGEGESRGGGGEVARERVEAKKDHY